MARTTIFNLPYQTANDAPDGSGLGYALAQWIEDQAKWNVYSPAVSYNSGSSGQSTFRWRREIGDVHVKAHIQFSGSGISANTIFADLPVKAASGEWPRGVSGRARDVSTSKTYPIYIEFTADASTNFQIEVLRADGTYVSADSGLSGAVPWDTGDWVDLDFLYTPQALY